MQKSTPKALLPTKVFLTKGVGRHREKLSSFELSLRQAKIAHLNLVRVSSIFPPRCRVISRSRGLRELTPGQVAYAVISESASNEAHRLIAASVGLAIPADESRYGYLSEHHSFGQTERQAGDYAEDLAAEMLATILGIPFDADKAWDARKEQWKLQSDIVETRNITQSAIGDKNGKWTTVIAAAILLP